jgi:hypothetical protein
MSDEWSVWIFFPDGGHVAEAQWIGPEAAVKLAYELTRRPAARVGIIERVIITDGGDFTCFEWQFGKGVTFPIQEAKT